MGTRNLTMVQLGGKYVVAQYCQWDGYPSGQGKTALTFARANLKSKRGREKFASVLAKCTDADPETVKARYMECGHDGDEWVTMEVSDKFKAKWPWLNRDMGADILEAIQNSNGLDLHRNVDFAADSLFCEWAYVIDLDANTFEVYKGFNEKPLPASERFAGLEKDADSKYYPIKLLASWPLDSLPTIKEFLAIDKAEEEEEAA